MCLWFSRCIVKLVMRLTSLCPPFSASPQQAQTERSGSQHDWNKQDRAWSHISLSTHTHSTTVCRLRPTFRSMHSFPIPTLNIICFSVPRTGQTEIKLPETIAWQLIKQVGRLKYNISPIYLFLQMKTFLCYFNKRVYDQYCLQFLNYWVTCGNEGVLAWWGVSVCLPLYPCSSTTLLWMGCVWPWAQIQQYQMPLLVIAEQWLSAPATNKQTCIPTINTILIYSLAIMNGQKYTVVIIVE